MGDLSNLLKGKKDRKLAFGWLGWCEIGEFSDYTRGYKRCCHYANRRRDQAVQPTIRVKVCRRLNRRAEKVKKEKKERRLQAMQYCGYNEFEDWSKGYFRCCHYQNRRRDQAIQPRIRVKVCRRMRRDLTKKLKERRLQAMQYCGYNEFEDWTKGYFRCCH